MIEKYSFGTIHILGQVYKDDVKICQGKVVSPWCRKSGHDVRIEDVRDMLDTNPEVIIFGQGQPGLMSCSQDLKELLRQKGIELIELPTAEAIKKFNDSYSLGRAVCGGFHLTC